MLGEDTPQLIKSKIHTHTKGGESIERLKKFLGASPKAYVTIGVHQDAGKYTKGGAPDIVQVALWNEFGTEHIPARSFVQATVDEHRSDIEKIRNIAINNIIEKGWTVEQALEMIGFRIQVLIQNKIKSNVQPAYGSGKGQKAPWQIQRAQRYKQNRGVAPVTLIDSTLLLRSIAFKVYLK